MIGFRFHRLLRVPRPPDDERTPAGLVVALTAAHAAGAESAIAIVWRRAVADGPIRIYVGGRPDFPLADGTGRVLFPPGAIGTPVDRCEIGAVAWWPCVLAPDPLWTAAQPRARGGFADVVAHTGEPFVWLVLAEPAPSPLVDAELAALTSRIPALRQRENSQPDRVALERAEGRFRELSRSATTGTWRVRVRVGAADIDTARRTAALLCAAGDLDDLPYVLTPAPTEHPTSPDCPVTTELLAALVRPPRRELPGVHVVEPADFDVTPEPGDGLFLGDVLDRADRPVDRMLVGTATLNRHTFVAGATGAGKSQTVRHLLESLHRNGIPWLVIEPAKAEYAGMAGRIGAERVAVIRPGAPDAVPLSLNPLAPEPGFPLATHIDLVRGLFLAAFEAAEPFPQILASALIRCYTELGWDTTLGAPVFRHAVPRHPDLGDLRRVALAVIAGVGYGREVADNVRGFVDVRIGSLRLGALGRFFGGGHPLDMADLLRRNVVLEVEDVGNDQDAAFLIGAVLIRMHEHLRVHRAERAGGLRHVTVIEEAHRLLKRAEQGSPAAHAVELFTSLLAEIRAYGEGIVVAEQIPTKIAPDVLKNTALKIVHRLPAADDRAAVGATMNLDEAQSRHVVSLPPGRAAVFTDGMDRSIRVTVPLGADREPGDRPTGEVAATRTAYVACPPACVREPCTLRQIVHGRRAADEPRLALWLEMLTIAHVCGYPEPDPAPAWLAGHTLDRRLDCAVAQLAADAVHRRYPALIEHYQPDDLARHVADRARAHLAGRGGRCDGSEVGWQAGQFRWRDVFVAFAQDHDEDEPHPLTDAWRARGLDLGDGPAREQFLNLQRLPGAHDPDRTAVDGGGDPPEHRRLAALLSRPGTPMGRFVDATGFLTFTGAWPLHRLHPDEWHTWQANEERS